MAIPGPGLAKSASQIGGAYNYYTSPDPPVDMNQMAYAYGITPHPITPTTYNFDQFSDLQLIRPRITRAATPSANYSNPNGGYPSYNYTYPTTAGTSLFSGSGGNQWDTIYEFETPGLTSTNYVNVAIWASFQWQYQPTSNPSGQISLQYTHNVQTSSPSWTTYLSQVCPANGHYIRSAGLTPTPIKIYAYDNFAFRLRVSASHGGSYLATLTGVNGMQIFPYSPTWTTTQPGGVLFAGTPYILYQNPGSSYVTNTGYTVDNTYN